MAQESEATTHAEDWKEQIERLINIVNCECKRKLLTPRRKAVLAILLVIFFISGVLLLWISLTVAKAILSYSTLLSSNQTSSNSQLGFLVEQMPSYASLSISVAALIIAMGAVILPTVKALTPEELANWYYGKLSKDVDVKNRPYLKALINMKCKEIDLSLWDNYQNCIRTKCDLFGEKSLLKSLYG